MACMQLWDCYEVMFENKIADYCIHSLDGSRRFVHIHLFRKIRLFLAFCLSYNFVFDHGLFEWLSYSFVGCWWSVKANRPPLCKESDNQIIKP